MIISTKSKISLFSSFRLNILFMAKRMNMMVALIIEAWKAARKRYNNRNSITMV